MNSLKFVIVGVAFELNDFTKLINEIRPEAFSKKGVFKNPIVLDRILLTYGPMIYGMASS